MSQSLNLSGALNVAFKANAELAKSAAYLEAGRIVNNKLAQLVAPKLPVLFRGYATTPVGRLVLANAIMVAAQKFRPADQRLAKLGYAAVTEAYGQVFEGLNIEALIDSFIGDSAIASVLNTIQD